MADTDIELAVDLNVTDAEKTAKQLQKEIEDIFHSRSGESSAALTRLEIQMKKNYDAAEALKEKLYELGEDVESASYSKIKDEIAVAEDRFDALADQIGRGQSAVEKYSKAYERLNYLLSKTDTHNAVTSYVDAEGFFGEAGKYWNQDELIAYREQIKNLIMPYKELQAEQEKIGQQLDALYQQKQELEDTHQAVIIGKETEAYQQAEIALDAVNDKLKQQVIYYNELQDRQPFRDSQSDVADVTKSMRSLNMTTRGLSRLIPGLNTSAIYGVTALSNGITRLTHLTKVQLVGAIKNVGKAFHQLMQLMYAHPWVVFVTLLVTTIILAVKKLKEAKAELEKDLEELAEKAKELLKDIGNIAGKIIKGVADGLTYIGSLITGTIYRGLKSLFNKVYVKGVLGGLKAIVNKLLSLKSLITEELKLMAKWNGGNNKVNKSLSNLTSSLAYLKAAITTAFAPILTTIEPILTRIIDSLAEAATAVGMFIAALTGQSTFQRAIRRQKDYADSLKETNNQLASFDKLNVISQNKSGDDVGFSLIDVEEVELQKQSIEDWFNSLEEKGRKVGETVTNFLTNIPWGDFEKGAGKAGKAFSKFINGITETEGFGTSVGKTFAGLFNTITSAINGFLKDLDAENLGKQIGDALTTMVTETKWGDFGDTFSILFDKLCTIIIEVLSPEANGENLGTKVGDAFVTFLTHALNVDWDRAGEAFGLILTNLQSFFERIFDKKKGLDFETLGTKIGRFLKRAINKVDWEKTGTVIFNGFKSAIRFLYGLIRGLTGEKLAQCVSDFIKGACSVEKLDWDSIQESLNGIATELVAFLNGIITPENAIAITQTLTKVITSIFTSINLFGKEAEWETWGRSIGEAFNAFLDDDEMWKIIPETINTVAHGLFDMLIAAIDEINWFDGPNSVAGRICQLIADIDWAGLAGKINEISGKLSEALSQIWDRLKETGAIDSIMRVIVQVLNEKDRWEKQIKNIREDIIASAFKQKLGGTFGAIGTYLLDCIMNPITHKDINYWKKVVEGTSVSQLYNTVKGKVDEMKGMTLKYGIEDTFGVSFSTNTKELDNNSDVINDNTTATKQLTKQMSQQELEAAQRSGAYTGQSSYYLGPQASGTVIPPSHSKYLATVGDNNHETEVISPLSTIKQALQEALGEQKVNVVFQVEGDPNGIFKVVQKESLRYNQRTGVSAFA